MRLIDADELMEHVGRDKLDSRELIRQMIENAPTIKSNELLKEKYKRLLQLKKEIYKPAEQDSDWWFNRKTGIIDGLEIAFETFTNMRS